jgi:hypothetical protein
MLVDYKILAIEGFATISFTMQVCNNNIVSKELII